MLSLSTNKQFNYLSAEDRIVSLGYENPSIDSGDVRQREIWNTIKQNNLSVKIILADLVNDLASHEDPWYKFFQCRQNSENSHKIDELYKSFFEKNETLKRLPMAFKIQERLYISVGNHRCRAIAKGLKENPDSNFKSHIILIDFEDHLADDQKVTIGSQLANISNRQTKDTTEPETSNDITHQINTQFELLQITNPEVGDWSDEEKITWAKEWCEIVKTTSSDRIIAVAVNAAFASHIGQSIPWQTDEILNNNWKMFWPAGRWFPEEAKVPQKKYVTHYNNFKNTMFNAWFARSTFTIKNDRIQACVRCGSTMSSDITSEESVEKQRKSYIKDITEWNSNNNIINAGMPILTKIMFVKQTSIGNYEAWEWSEETETFVQKRLDSSI